MHEHDLRESGFVCISGLRAKLAYSCNVFGLVGCLFGQTLVHLFCRLILGLRAKIVLCLVFGLLGFLFDM